MSDKRLLIDQGNTLTKFCFVESHGELSDIAIAHDIHEIPVKGVSAVRIASVRNEQSVLKLYDYLSQDIQDISLIKTQREAFGVACAYEHYQSLGIDRWLAVLGAAAITKHACAIVDFGTANTVDFLHAGKHLGGWISPGIKSMRKGLIESTANVFSDDEYPSELKIGTKTESCVAHGCLANLFGLLLLAEKELTKISANGKIFLVGGVANELDLTDFSRVERREKLVFEGLKRFL